MRMNKVRRLLLICNILFILFGIVGFSILTPALNKLVEADAKQELVNNVQFVTDAIRNDSVTHNYGLTVYTIPRDGNRKLKTDMYTFYIIDELRRLLYTSNPKFKKQINYRKYDYIDNGFVSQDNAGDIKGIQGNEIHYITTRIIVRNISYILVYEIDRDKIQRDVYTLIGIFSFGYIFAIGIIAILSWWIDKQYKVILHNQLDIIEAYKLLDNTGDTIEPYLDRIKKILHSFAFTTAILFAINKDGVTIFRNRATLEAQKELFGEEVPLPKTPDGSNWVDYRDEWDYFVTRMLTTDDIYVEWESKTYDYNGEVVYTKNRIKKIIVNREIILICEIQDITNINLANEEIQKYTEYLLAIFNTVQDVILVINYQGEIQNANRAILNVFGYTLEEVKDNSLNMIIENDYREISSGHFLSNGRKKDGTIIKCEIHKNSLDDNDNLELLVIQDITEREALKEQIYASIAISTETIKTLAGNI